MQRIDTTKIRILITGSVTLLLWGLLGWQHFHGGVPRHHLLDQEDLPEISNWWGGLVLPGLTWLLLGPIERRLTDPQASPQASKPYLLVLGRFVLGLVLGIGLALSFTYSYAPFLNNVLYLLLLLSVVVPIFYGEFILGFVYGMTFTFGAVLPSIFIGVMAALGFVVYRLVRIILPRVRKVFAKQGA